MRGSLFIRALHELHLDAISSVIPRSISFGGRCNSCALVLHTANTHHSVAMSAHSIYSSSIAAYNKDFNMAISCPRRQPRHEVGT